VTILCPLASSQPGGRIPALTVRAEITAQRALDQHRGSFQTILEARIAAVIAAREALTARQVGAGWALRQSLVDLASICEALASELPEPGGRDDAA
jgi:hypothetical protein